MTAFLEKIANRLLEKFPKKMDQVAIVLPSKRAIVFFKHYLAKKITEPSFLPDFFSIEEFVENISGLKVIDNMTLQFKLYSSYLKYSPKKIDDFEEFLKWSTILLNDFNEIDRNLVDANSIYTNLKDIKHLEGWNSADWSFSNTNLTKMQIDYISFFENMLLWYKDFTSNLLADKFAYQGLANKKAVDMIGQTKFIWKKVWFVGLNALTKSEEEILNFLKKENIARVFWDADKFYFDNEVHEAGSFLRAQRSKWSEIEFDGVGDYFSKPKENFNVISCPKNISQAKVTSQILSSLSPNDLNDSSTAVILADENLLYPVLHNLPSNVKKLNVTMGSPLALSPLNSFIELILNMHVNSLKYNHEFYYKDVLSLIDQTYFLRLATQKDVILFKEYIIENNAIFLNRKDAEIFFKDKKVVDLFSCWKDVHSVIDVLFSLILNLRNNIVKLKSSVESEVLTTYFKLLVTLQKLTNEYDIDLKIKTFKNVFQQLIANEMIPFQGEPLVGLQLMGILESRTLDFKNVIVLSVNEEKLPQGKKIQSFIPYDMKKFFKMSTYKDRDAVFAYHFYRLLQRANNISLLYNSETDDFGNGEKSRFITQLQSEYNGRINELVYSGSSLSIGHKHHNEILNENLDDKIIKWAISGVSPTALNIYNNCSLYFYYHYLAKFRIEDRVEEYADESIMGTAIHNSLDEAYIIGEINEKIILKIQSCIDKILQNQFLNLLSDKIILEGKNYLSLQIAKKLTDNFLNYEKIFIKECQKNNLSLRLVEKEIDLSYNLLVDKINFKIVGKIDRIDTLDNQLRIIDYKTGKVDSHEVVFSDLDDLFYNPNKSKALQLLIYTFLYIRNYPSNLKMKIIAGIYSFKNLQNGLLYVKQKKSSGKATPHFINEVFLNDFETKLKELIQRIKSSNFLPHPHTKKCYWCEDIAS